MVLYPLAEGDKLATCSVKGVILFVLVQHAVLIAEETPGEVKLAMIGYGATKKAQGDEMVRRLCVFPLSGDWIPLLTLPPLLSVYHICFAPLLPTYSHSRDGIGYEQS